MAAPSPKELREVLGPSPGPRAEWWWGGPCQRGTSQPYGVTASADKADGIAWKVDFGELLCNQSNPVLVSSEGRYVWSSAPCIIVGHSDGRLSVTSSEGSQPPAPGDVAVGEGHGNLRGAFRAAAKAHFPASGYTPDPVLIKAPQYNLWIECHYWPTQAAVLLYAKQVLEHGMPAGVIMIDTNWALHYGSFEFNKTRFPDPRAMAEELHELGFKLMVWITPFISPDSTTFRYAEAKGYLLKNPMGMASVTRWWDGYSALLDPLNPRAVEWFEEGLEGLRVLGVDGFKMDGGDPEYYAQVTRESVGESLKYTEAFAAMGLKYKLAEYRACWKQAGTHLCQRLCDKNHAWGTGGLAALIPNGVAQGLAGYAFGCPDMIGGGQYADFYQIGTLEARCDIDQELFVRFAQVSALFPMMQFSLAPWRVLDKGHLAACVDAANLHAKLGDYLWGLAEEAAHSGEPILRCMEYVFPQQVPCPTDQQTLSPTFACTHVGDGVSSLKLWG